MRIRLSIRGTVLDAHELDADRGLQQAWRATRAQRADLRSPFFSLGFVRAAAHAFGRVRVLILEEDGRTCGFFPFQFRSVVHARGGWAERVGGELSDYFGIIAPTTFQTDAATLLRRAGLSHVYFTHLDESQKVHGLAGERPEVGLAIELRGGAEAYWKELGARDKKLVVDTERRERGLIKACGALSFVLDDRRPDALLHLMAQKREQYARTEVGDPLEAKSASALLDGLWNARDPEACGMVSTLVAGDTWVASHFGLRAGRLLHYWFPVYNAKLRQFSPGRLLMKHVIQSGEFETIDRGQGDTQAKRDFANVEHTFFRGVWQRQVPRAWAYGLAQRLRWRFDALWDERSRRRSKNANAGAATER